MSRRSVFVIRNLFYATLHVICVWGMCSCHDKTENHQQSLTLPSLTVGIQSSPAMTLVMVAEDKGFFDEAGVDVEIKEFTAGKFALQAFLGGSLDIAVSGEVPVALATLQGNRFRVLAQVVKRTVNECRVVARREEGATSAKEYFMSKRRKLATSFGGGPEYFTHCFLAEHNIGLGDVDLISQRPEDMPATLASGSVDAISIFDPFARIAEIELGTKGITFADADIYSELYVVNVMQKTIDQKGPALLAFLKGLNEAARFTSEYSEEAKAILMKYTRLDKNIVDGIWPNFIFKPALTPLFLEYTEAQAKWAVEKGTFPANTVIPDFRSILFIDFLQRVDSVLVTIE